MAPKLQYRFPMKTTAIQIAAYAATIRAAGTGATFKIGLTVGHAEIYMCPQPHLFECWLTLKGAPAYITDEVDSGSWETLEGALRAVYGPIEG